MGPSRGRAVCRVAVAVMALTVGATDAGAKKKRKEFDRCPECTSITTAFEKGFGSTKGKSSGAGNTEWEESRGIKYSTSEQRLYEISENLCGSGKHDHKCHAFYDTAEEIIEAWWYDREDKSSTAGLWDHLCVAETKACCPKGHWGASCSKCPGGVDNPCSGHGSCDGDGKRIGKGKCKCNGGYTGKQCNKCKKTHFRKDSDSDGAEKWSCEPCHVGCKGGCVGSELESCKDCADGYEKAASGAGCSDVDECKAGSASCEGFTFCKNTIGNYTCQDCDPACHPDDGCTAVGPKGCSEGSCADGYELDDVKGCIDLDECKLNATYCEVGKYCYNTPGSVSCLPCAVACEAGKGCVNGTPLGCNECRSGFRRPEGKDIGCEDIDECANPDACGTPGMTCRNTRGSFECNCISPKKLIDGKCVEAPPPPASEADKANAGEGTATEAKATSAMPESEPVAAKDEL